jgi:molecular chaperone DnaK
VVAVNPKTGERMVGQIARRQAITNPENTIFSVKRFMGRKFNDPEVQRALSSTCPTRCTNANGDVQVEMGGKTYSPPEISAMILQKLKTDAEAYLGEPVTQAVITVPAYFNDSQRQATKDAGRIAGLEVLRIINEPTASAWPTAWTRRWTRRSPSTTWAAAPLTSPSWMWATASSRSSTNGDTFLGGDDFDQRIMDYVADEFRKEQGIDLRSDRRRCSAARGVPSAPRSSCPPRCRRRSTCRSSPPTPAGPSTW